MYLGLFQPHPLRCLSQPADPGGGLVRGEYTALPGRGGEGKGGEGGEGEEGEGEREWKL